MKQRIVDNRLHRFRAWKIASAIEAKTGIRVARVTVQSWKRQGLPRWGAAAIVEVLDEMERDEVTRG